ncbi:MAG: hypothetical protein ACKOS8_14555, partial [Gemmataceae bacterium]
MGTNRPFRILENPSSIPVLSSSATGTSASGKTLLTRSFSAVFGNSGSSKSARKTTFSGSFQDGRQLKSVKIDICLSPVNTHVMEAWES